MRRAGTVREIVREVPAADVGFDDPRVDAARPVSLELEVESLTDGVLVHGRLAVGWHGECRRCLAPIATTADVDVDELYQRQPTNPDAHRLEGDQLDLRTMVRDTLLLAVPDAPLCRPDCRGLCPRCGADLNEAPCGCGAADVDR
ncbi:MAG: YceD family protein [Ilumatobacteraceae bacterium]|jgi:uncharacterized protein